MPTETLAPETRYNIEGLDCANCAMTLQQGIAGLAGIDQAHVDFTTATLTVSGTTSAQTIRKRVRAMGYHVTEPDAEAKPAAAETGGGFFAFMMKSPYNQMVLVLAALLLISLPAALLLPRTAYLDGTLLTLHVLVAVLAGGPIAWKGIKSLVYARRVTIELLMGIATVGALAIGETGEAATVIVLFAVGEALEGFSADRARDALRGLLALRPDTVTLLRPCEEHGIDEVSVPVEEAAVGELALILPGERVAVDGVVETGASQVDQAAVTGESLPVDKNPGDPVYAGTMNGSGVLEVRISREASDSTISQIAKLVAESQAKRTEAERFIDRFAAWYTPAVVVLAVLVAVVPPLFFGAPFLDVAGTHGWLYRALALLIIACPCALVISTPVSVVSALSGLARRGVLVKGGAYLDVLARVEAIAFDKTGTLTGGEARVMRVQAGGCEGNEQCGRCDEVVALAAAVERRSEHMLAGAIVGEAEARGVLGRYPASTGATAMTGQGISGTVDGMTITVGSHRYFHESGLCTDDLHGFVQGIETHGETAVLVARDGQLIGAMGIGTASRGTAADSLDALKRFNPALHLEMLTGDSPEAAGRIAAELPILDSVQAGLMPADKVAAVERLRERYEHVAMVGDGINDSPALAAASVGVAMGGAGSPQAIEVADAVLMGDALDRLPDLLHTSRRTRRVIAQNIAFSLVLKLAFLMLALPGITTLWMAVLADMGASLLVTFNGMRLLREGRR